MTNIAPQALGHLRVLDLAGASGQPAGRILADWGADVIKIEPPGGDPARLMAPFAGGDPHREKSLFFLHNNTNKRSAVLDVRTPDGAEAFKRLVSEADVVLETFKPGLMATLGLDYERLSALNPALIMTSITPFGQTGPHRDFEGPDIVSVAMGGLLYLEGEPGERPYTMPRYQAWQMAGIHAAYGTLLALYERLRSGRGQWVDVSVQEVLAHQMFTLSLFGSIQQIPTRMGQTSQNPPNTYFPCRDGKWVHLSVYQDSEWQNLIDWIKDPVLSDPSFIDSSYRQAQVEVVDALVTAYTAQYDREEVLRQAWSHRVAASAANSIRDFIDDPHVAERDWMVEVEHPLVGRYLAPGPPIRASATPWRIVRPAPLLGQHTDEVLGGIDQESERRSTGPAGDQQVDPGGVLPLDGVRILDFARVWAGGFGSRHLADFGATMMKVESAKFPDFRDLDPEAVTWRASNTRYGEINRNKLSIALDMHFDEARELARGLVGASDAVIENSAARTMDRMGLSYQELREIKPDIIMVRCPGFGLVGPLRDVTSYGGSVTAFSGLGHLWGYPDEALSQHSKQVLPDFVAAANLALATVLGLLYRAETGRGQLFEVAQFESGAAVIGQAFVEQALLPAQPTAWGNRDPNAAPQGVYRCQGDDRWCAISCQSDDQWQALATLVDPGGKIVVDGRFATRTDRLTHPDELDTLIEAWTSSLTPHQVMYLCQRQGIAAGVVATGEDLFLDPHLRERGYVTRIDHAVPGPLLHPGMTVGLSRTPGRVQRPAPPTGHHTRELLGEVLGINESRMEALTAKGVLV